jgi:septal ring-binding cell division protein DamX
LRQPNIRQLRERITHSFTLAPLSPAEIGEYLMFRLRAVGYRGPDLFNSAVVKHIAHASKGLTRRVNLIADKALLAAFSENTHTVRGKHIAAAVRDSEFARDSQPGELRGRWLVIGGVLILLVLVLAAWAAYGYFGRTATRPAAASAPAPPAPANTAVLAPAPVSADPASSPAPNDAGNATVSESSSAPVPQAPSAEKQNAAAKDAPPVAVAEAQQPPAPEPPASLASTPPAIQKSMQIQGDILSSRIQATREWLTAEAPQTLSIQLLGTESAEQLKDHLNIIAKSVEIQNVYVYRTVAKQKPFLIVLYGSFGSREAAQGALERLPPPLRAFKPYLRTVQGVRDEMSRNNTL